MVRTHLRTPFPGVPPLSPGFYPFSRGSTPFPGVSPLYPGFHPFSRGFTPGYCKFALTGHLFVGGALETRSGLRLPFTVYCLLFTVYRLLFTVYRLLFTSYPVSDIRTAINLPDYAAKFGEVIKFAFSNTIRLCQKFWLLMTSEASGIP